MVKKLHGILRQFLKDLASTAIVPVVFLIAVAVIALHFVEPAPPNRIVISTGLEQGAYHGFAERYRAILARDGVTLELRPSEGAVENLKRLNDAKSGVDLGFVQGGLTTPAESPGLDSLGSLYYEPLWLFYRHGRTLTRLGELKGLRIAAGREGGGTRSLALRLLSSSGISDQSAELLALGGDEAAEALAQGRVDAAFFIATPEEALIQKLLRLPRIRLMSLDQAEAYVRQFHFLHHLVLPHGAIDIAANIPGRDTDLVAPTATLVARDSLHPALVYLLLQAATDVHSGPGIFRKEHEFPADRDTDLALDDQAEHFYKSGPPFLRRVLPFWLATLLDRMLVLIIPLIAVLIPLTRIVPALYGWRVKRRVYRWYGELSFLEAQAGKSAGPKERARCLEKLDSIEERVNSIRLPLAFAEHLYVLREHIDLVRRRLIRDQDRAA
jgi:TRAP-type uncharacterized transport system substrate-binding protein